MKILVIEDEPSVRLGLCTALKAAGHRVSSAGTAADGISLFDKEQHELIVTDLVMPGGEGGMEVLAAVKSRSAQSGVIVMTAFGTVKTAVEAMRRGAFDYITKPFDAEELLIAIDRFISQTRLEEENLLLREEVRDKRRLESMVGASPVILKLCDTIRAAAHSDASVLILGETGTGKELVANALCALSPRRDKPFIKINCAAIPETLFESELFGYEKGAFTGAVNRRKGKLEAAYGGTVLLDEIGDMPLMIQAKLLRVIEERRLERLGGNEGVALDVRFLFATARNLKEAIRAGSFREDLYYRINVLPLRVPPLRERQQDIPLLVRHFLEESASSSGRPALAVSPEAMRLLERHDYPGNVRELKHALAMAATLCQGTVITPLHLPEDMRSPELCEEPDSAADGPALLTDKVRHLERELIQQALEESGGRKALAAERLGICRRTLWKKMRDLQFPNLQGEEDEG